MKNINASFILLIIIITAAGSGCKKHNQGSSSTPPPPEKKWVVSTIAGDGSDAFANGPVLSAKFHTPVDVAVAHVVGPELADHGIEPGAARLIHRVSRLVGVDHDGAEVAQHRRDGRLSRARAACQPNELQFA